MRSIIVTALAASAGIASAQHVDLATFSPGNIAATTAVFTDISALTPSSGSYVGAYISADWSAVSGNPWSSEARAILRRDPLLNYLPEAPGGNNAGDASARPLFWLQGFSTAYNGGTPLFFGARQTFAGSVANWSNVRISLIQTWALTNSSRPNAIDLGGFGTGGPTSIFVETNWSGRNIPSVGTTDTEIGLFDSAGNLLGTDDDLGIGLNSQLLSTLDEGTYYVAVAGFNAAFSDNFGVTGGTATGRFRLAVNGVDDFREFTTAGQVAWYSFEVVPAPGAAVVLGLAGLTIGRRRR